jgi:hypothetical protein
MAPVTAMVAAVEQAPAQPLAAVPAPGHELLVDVPAPGALHEQVGPANLTRLLTLAIQVFATGAQDAVVIVLQRRRRR